MEKNNRAQQPALGKVPTAADPNPSSNELSVGAGRKRAPQGGAKRKKTKAAVTIGPGSTSTRDVWLDKA